MSLKQVTVEQCQQACLETNAILIDIRGISDRTNGIPRNSLAIHANELLRYAKENFIESHVYYIICEKGINSKKAVSILNKEGINNAINVAKGFKHWKHKNLPIHNAVIDNHDLRYSRHYQLQGFGKRAQKKLNNAHVLLIGAGGLGSSSALYLAAAGVGIITIIDDDTVELSNLQRQIIHTTASIDEPKVNSAKQRINALNPDIFVHTITERLDKDNADQLIHQADVIIDGTDNLETRYLVNDLCLKHRKPLIYAAVYQFEAQISVFDMRQDSSPCLRCLFPKTKGFEPENCSTVGVLGVVPGFAGILQASEAIKIIAQVGQSLQSKLLICNLLDNSFRTIKYNKDKGCKFHS